MGVVLASGLRGPAFGRPPKLVDRGFQMAAGVPLTRGSEAKVAARTLRPGETRNKGPDSARIFGPGDPAGRGAATDIRKTPPDRSAPSFGPET